MNGLTSLFSFFSQVKPSKRRWLKENYAQTELIADIVTVLSSLVFLTCPYVLIRSAVLLKVEIITKEAKLFLFKLLSAVSFRPDCFFFFFFIETVVQRSLRNKGSHKD